ncbi:hypothetical protein EJD97_000165 [Solanum chilense]|uniref:Retrotransposon gag domain-containing protein n=1 Tax=Solanum chilense TaxID=4083 RepID=A0A6N2C768_SOLCI|nr:hypothetical protein EJD97_000165 [Solanum chilense]
MIKMMVNYDIVEWKPIRRVDEEVVNEGVPLRDDQVSQDDQISLANQENEVSVVPQGEGGVKEVVQLWYTHWKHNRPVESAPIEWKELKEAFLGNYLTRETKEKHFEKCLAGTTRCYGCGKNDFNVRDCPTISSRGRDVKKFPYNGPIVGEQNKNNFYNLQADKQENVDEGVDKL